MALFSKNDLVWTPCNKDGYKLMKVEHVDIIGKKLLVKDRDENTYKNEKVSVKLCYKYVDDTDKDDNTSLTSLDPANILENIRVRFSQGKIYTNTANVLLALNPYRKISNLYSEETKRSYYGKHLGQMPPHPYSIADSSYRNMVLDKKNHAIVISGESGAGKTETAKIVMSYLAEVGILPNKNELTEAELSGMTEKQRKRLMQIRLSYASHTIFGEEEAKDIQQRILSANPILEAFGNARTVRNYNSSRFGRLNKLYYNEHGFLKGGGITTYLLESSRCVKHNHNERTYHCFYQLIHGLKESELNDFHLIRDVSKYNLLNQGNLAYNSEMKNDIEQFEILRQSFDINGIDKNRQNLIFKILSGIILLGNINFIEKDKKIDNIKGEQLEFEDIKLIENISELFGIDKELLIDILLVKHLKIGNNQTPVAIARTNQQSLQLIHSIIRSIYIRLFNWVVCHINKFTSCKDEDIGFTSSPRKQNILNSQNSLYIGILDIYGFEKLEINSFEQLCINLANEKLQEFFVEKVLQSEQKLYQQEGLVWKNIEIPKTQPVLDLIFDLFSLLDDDSRLKSQGQDRSDYTYWQRINNKYGKSVHNAISNPVSSPSKLLDNSSVNVHQLIKFPLNGLRKVNMLNVPICFSIQHYAGSVEYTLNGWLEKNHDKIIPELEEILENSNNEIFNSIIDLEYKSRKSASFRSVSKKFTKDLKDMIQDLGEISLQFIRCFIPNSHMRSDIWDGNLVLNQMIQSGTIQMVKLMHYGYPNRANYSNLIIQIRNLLPEKYVNGLSDRMIVEFFLSAYNIPSNTYQFGISKLFLKSGQYGRLLDQVNDYKRGSYDNELSIPSESVLMDLKKKFNRKCLRRCILVVEIVCWLKNRFLLLIKKRREIMNLLSIKIYRWYLFYRYIIIPLKRRVSYRMPYILGIKQIDEILINNKLKIKKYTMQLLQFHNRRLFNNEFDRSEKNKNIKKITPFNENDSDIANRINEKKNSKNVNINTTENGLVGLEIWKQELYSFFGYKKSKKYNYLMHYDGSNICLLEVYGDEINTYELYASTQRKYQELTKIEFINTDMMKDDNNVEYYSEYIDGDKFKRINYEIGNPLCLAQHPIFNTSFILINEKGSIITFKLKLDLFPDDNVIEDNDNYDKDYWDIINSTPSTKLPNLGSDIYTENRNNHDFKYINEKFKKISDININNDLEESELDVYLIRNKKTKCKIDHISTINICSNILFNEYIPFEWIEEGHIFVPLKVHFIDPTSYQYLGILWHVEYSKNTKEAKEDYLKLPFPNSIKVNQKNKRRNISEDKYYSDLSYNERDRKIVFDGLFTIIDLSSSQILNWLNFPFKLSSIVEEWNTDRNKDLLWDKINSYHPKCWCNLFGFAMKDSQEGNSSLIYDVIPTADVLKETCFISSEKLDVCIKDFDKDELLIEEYLIFLGGPKLGLILSLEIHTTNEILLEYNMNIIHDLLSIAKDYDKMNIKYDDFDLNDKKILENSCWFTTSLWLKDQNFNLQTIIKSNIFPKNCEYKVKNVTLLLGAINGRIISINLNKRNCPKIAVISPFESEDQRIVNARSSSIVSIFNLNNNKVSCISSTGDMITIHINQYSSNYLFSDKLHICLDKRYRPFIVQFLIFNSKIGQNKIIDNNLTQSFIFLDAVEKNLVIYNKNLGVTRSIATII